MTAKTQRAKDLLTPVSGGTSLIDAIKADISSAKLKRLMNIASIAEIFTVMSFIKIPLSVDKTATKLF